jgi:hypothetical protein
MQRVGNSDTEAVLFRQAQFHNPRLTNHRLSRSHAYYVLSRNIHTDPGTGRTARGPSLEETARPKAEAQGPGVTAPPAPLVNLSKGQITPRSWLTSTGRPPDRLAPCEDHDLECSCHSFGVLCRTGDTH